MEIDKVEVLKWSDNSWNVFMKHDTAAIQEFVKNKLKKSPDCTYTKIDMPLKQFNETRGV